MNYHYQVGSKKAQDLRRELFQIDNSLKGDYKSIEKLKLESEFYQDHKHHINQDKMNIADQIMSELIANPVKIPPQKHYPINQIKESPILQPPIQPMPKKDHPFHNQLQFIPQQPRQNNFINQRQAQKNKLQNQKHQGLFPNTSDHSRQRSYGKQPQQVIAQSIPQQNVIDYYNQPIIKGSIPAPTNSNNYRKDNVSPVNQKVDPMYSPFLKNEQIQKEKKLQKQRQHLRQLQQQRIQQQKKKQERLRQQKLFKGQIYDHFTTKNQNEKPIIAKKIDPNGLPPKIEKMGNFSQFDSMLIKSKAIQIKSRYRKGKIIYEQYERELNKLRKQYPGNFEELLQENPSIKYQRQQERIQQQEYQKIQPNSQVVRQNKQIIQSHEIPQSNRFGLKNEINSYSQYMPQMQQMQNMMGNNPNLNFSLPQQSMMQANPSNLSPQYMQFFKKMFQVCIKQVKEVYTERIIQQDHNYQQTLHKIYLQTQNNFQTQQIPPQTSQNQKQIYSDGKQIKESIQKQSNIKKRNNMPNSSESLIPFGQSDNSQYYDKSLSAIASKIPLNYLNSQSKDKMDKPQKTNRQTGLNQFYKKKYKTKKLQNFPILININQSQLQIPSTSTYLKTKNALEELQFRFNEDLQELKRLQMQKSVNKLSSQLQRNTIYASERRVTKEPILQTVQSGYTSNKSPQLSKSKSKQKVNVINPFLKKHVSTDENIMTFNQRDLQLNSPINSYSPKSKKEILQQDEYQTEPRVRQQYKNVPSYVEQYEQRLNIPNKALNFIKMNNQIFSKYQKTEESAKKINSSEYIKQNTSKDYFNNNSISPVKRSDNYYQQSLETIKSDFEDPQKSHQYLKGSDYQLKKISKSPEEPLKASDRPHLREEDIAGYSQTVESVEESSARVSRPPIAKKRNLSKKKESSIVRSKLNSNDGYAGKSFNNDQSVGNVSASKFDSNIYESQYQQSAQKIQTKINVDLIQNKHLNQNINYVHIEISPPTINAPRSGNSLSPKKNQQPLEEDKSGLSKYIQPQGKWKSLQQARKLAKQCRKQKDQSKEYRSVEQRFSQLQSFMTKKGDQSYSVIKRQQQSQAIIKHIKKKQPRNILKILQSLQSNLDEDYRQQFDSYREESQQYQ